jgi:cation transport ATPase
MDSGNLARTELLSSCYAAMRPPQAIWRRYLVEVDRLSKEGRFSKQDHEVLRLSLNAPEELMEVTRGEIDGITEANLRTILNRLEQTFTEEKEKEIERLRMEQELIQKNLEDANRIAQEKEAQLGEAAAREEALRNRYGIAEKDVAIETLKGKVVEGEAKARQAEATIREQGQQIEDLKTKWQEQENARKHRQILIKYFVLLVAIIAVSFIAAWWIAGWMIQLSSWIGIVATRALIGIVVFILSHLCFELSAGRKEPMKHLWLVQQISKFRSWLWSIVILGFVLGVVGNLVANQIQKNHDNQKPPTQPSPPVVHPK